MEVNTIIPTPTTEEEFLVQREYRIRTLKNCGIYIIKNTINDHIYIGSSRNISQRFSQHKCDLIHNRHKNSHLQNAWNKYGGENFEFFMIESHSYPEKILGRENRYIKLYIPEYNNIQVNKTMNFYHSDETKRKIGIKSREKFIKNPELRKASSDRLKSRPAWNLGRKDAVSEEHKRKLSELIKKRGPIKLSKESIDKIAKKLSIPIFQYDLNNNFIKMWNSGADAARFYKAASSGNFITAIKKGIKLYNSYWKRA